MDAAKREATDARDLLRGVELYWDRPTALWPRAADGGLAMITRALDLNALLKER